MVSGGLPRFGTMPTDALCHSSWPSGVAHGKRRRVDRKKLESWRAFYMVACGEDGDRCENGLVEPSRRSGGAFRIRRSSIKSRSTSTRLLGVFLYRSSSCNAKPQQSLLSTMAPFRSLLLNALLLAPAIDAQIYNGGGRDEDAFEYVQPLNTTILGPYGHSPAVLPSRTYCLLETTHLVPRPQPSSHHAS